MTPRMKYILRCTPSLGMVSIQWAKAVEALQQPQNTIKGVAFMRDGNGGEIAESRNKLVTMALDIQKNHDTWLFWLDDDVIPTPFALRQLYHHDAEIISGVYFTKEPDALSNPLIYPCRGGGAAKFEPSETPIEAWGHGMGLCLIKATVYEKIRNEMSLPLDKYGNPEWYKTNADYKVEYHGGKPVLDCGGTEDLYFLDMAGKCGFKPLVDCSKFAFGFHFDSRKFTGYPAKQWVQYSAGKKVEWDTANGPVVWE